MAKSFVLRIFIFLILTLIVAVSQIFLLKPHLQYGFSDVDWGFLSIYKTQNPYTLSQFIKNIETGGTLGGVYTHQIYYIGIQHELFGLDFKSFQITTHIFKILATLAIFPLFLMISGRWLVAFIGTILFASSYSSIGTMYTVVTSSDYSAIFFMGIFISFYWYIARKKIGNLSLLMFLLLLLFLTLFLSTERMYPLPLFIILNEGFIYWQRRKLEKNTIKRLLILFIPLILIFVIKPIVFLSYFLSHTGEIVKGIIDGNWNVLLTPIIALGSIVIPHDYTKYLGIAKLDNFGSFVEFIITGPLLTIATTSIIIGILVFKKPQVVILQLFGLMAIFSLALYVLGSHFTTHQINIAAIIQALVGLYIIAVAIVSFIFWRKQNDRLLIGLFVGPFFAFLYILLTWVGAATSEVFSGIHRYLTIPALFVDLFLSTLFTAMFINLYGFLKKFNLGALSFTVFIPLLLFINLNSQQISSFFKYQLASGFGSEDKNLMRNQLNTHLNNLSNDRPSLFYFDFMEDNDRGYYYDNTLLGGFGTWMLWHPSINFNKDLAPKAFWNNPKLLKESIQIMNGEKVIIFEEKLYNINNFYAFKLKDKKLIDIKNEVLQNE